MMDDQKLNDYLDEYGKFHSPEPSRALIDNIMAIPREMDQSPSFSWDIRDWFMFLVPRLSGLTAVCVLGIYMGSAGGTALAEDEIEIIDGQMFEVADAAITLDPNVDTLLDIEEFIFIEEPTQ